MRWSRLLRRGVFEHRGRAVVCIVSVALGVSLYLGVVTATRALSDSFNPGDFDGGPDNAAFLLPTGLGQTEAPFSAVEHIRSLPDVVSAKGGFRTTLEVDDVTIKVDGTEDDILGEIRMRRGRAPAPGSNEIALTPLAAQAIGVDVGKELAVTAPSGPTTVLVTGVFRAPPNEGDFQYGAFAPIARAWMWAGRADVVTSAYVRLTAGVDGTRWAIEHRVDLAGLQPPAYGLYQSDAQQFFRQIEHNISPVATAALAIAGYLIFLTFARTVEDRRQTHATMRAIGASRAQVIRVVLGEATLFAIVGTALGVGLGSVTAPALAAAMSNAFDISVADTGGQRSFSITAIAVVLGLFAPLAAAFAPALRASRAEPGVALREPDRDPTFRPTTAVAGAAVFAVGWATTSGFVGWLGGAGVAIAMAGAIVTLPWLARAAAALTRPVMARLGAGGGELAANRLARQPGRAATTAGLVAVTLALVFMVQTFSVSSRPALAGTLRASVGDDLRVYDHTNRGFAPPVVEAVRTTPGVMSVSPGATGLVELLDKGGQSEFLSVIDPASYFDVTSFDWATGTSAAGARSAMGHGGHVLLATSITKRTHHRVGDAVTLQTLRGPKKFTLAGAFAGLGYGESKAVVISANDAARFFDYKRPNRLFIDTAGGGNLFEAGAVQAAAVEAAGGEPDTLSVQPTALFRANVLSSFDESYGLVTLIVVLALSIALAGLANAMVLDVLTRRREIGIIRAIGASRSDIVRMVAIESVALTVTASVFAIAVGTVLARAMLGNIRAETGAPIAVLFPLGAVAGIVVAGLVTGVAGSIAPARRAVTFDPAEAMRSI